MLRSFRESFAYLRSHVPRVDPVLDRAGTFQRVNIAISEAGKLYTTEQLPDRRGAWHTALIRMCERLQLRPATSGSVVMQSAYRTGETDVRTEWR